jgi:hypothetical protein
MICFLSLLEIAWTRLIYLPSDVDVELSVVPQFSLKDLILS